MLFHHILDMKSSRFRNRDRFSLMRLHLLKAHVYLYYKVARPISQTDRLMI